MAKKPTRQIMTFSDYARHQGVTYQAVRKWYTQGYLVCVSRGRVDVEKSDAKIVARGPVGPGSKSPPRQNENKTTIIDGSAPYSHAEAMRVKENYAALARQLEYERDAGSVIEVAKVKEVVAKKLAQVRSKILSLGATIAPRGYACRTPEELKALIDAEVTRALDELTAEAALSIK